MVTGVLVNEALAYGDMGQAVACLAPASVATAISLWGTDEQQQTYLPAFTGDDVPAAALAVAESRPLFDPFELQTTATATEGGYRLTGVKSAVVRGTEAELFVVAAALDGTPRLFVVESSTPGPVSYTPFGEPIAHRQAVAFMVANIAIELEGMRLVTLKAASRHEQGRDASREIALARKLAAEYGMKIGTDGVQLLGGHGFVKEHPVERWYRDLRAVGVLEGAVLV